MKRVPAVIVCANSNETRQSASAARTPDDSLFNVYVAVPSTRISLGGVLMRAVMRRIRRAARDIDNITLAELRIDSARKKLAVVVDGLVIDIRPPLFYRIRPRALRVLAPQLDQTVNRIEPVVDSTSLSN